MKRTLLTVNVKKIEFLKSIKKLISFFWSQWFLIAIGLAIMFAYLFPNFAGKGGLIRSEYSINYGAVGTIFFLSGLSMETQKLVHMIVAWKGHIFCQAFSFLVTSSIMFGFAEIMRLAHNDKIDDYILVGFIICGVTPTTVSSNVVMTIEAGGNDSLSLIEVVIGNLMGAFISPLLVQLYLGKNTGFSFANPTKSIEINNIYKQVMKNMGISLFAPLFVGQVMQFIFPGIPKFIKKYNIGRIGSFCLVLMIFSSFSTAFKEKSFAMLKKESMILVVFFNIGIYIFFTMLCLLLARLPMLPQNNKMTKFLKFNKKDTVALMLCGAAKTIALGIPLIYSQWGSNVKVLGLVSVPLILYQSEQIVIARLMVPFMKKWVELETSESGKSNFVAGLIVKNGDDYDNAEDTSSLD